MATKGQELTEARTDSPARRMATTGSLVMAVLAAALAPVARADEPYVPFKAEGGPLDIRLVAVRPDAGEQFYDPNGQEIAWTGGVLDITDEPWGDQYRRDFIFRFPDTREAILFDIWHGVHLCGTRQYLKRAGIRPMGIHDGGQFYKWSTTFPRKSQEGMIAGLVPRSVAVRQVDLVMRYFYGPPQDPICTFTGPFELGRMVNADENLPYQMTCEQTYRMSGTITYRLTFSIDVLRDESVSVVLYDAQGRRRHPLVISRGSRPFASFHGPLEEIVKVTLGERAYVRTFRNVVVEYPHLPVRDHAAYLDRAIAALEVQRPLSDRLTPYSIRTPSQAMTVIDLIQGGELARRVLDVVAEGEPRIEISRVDEANRRRLLAAARKWAASWDLYMRFYGVRLGLLGGWPEFFDQAVALLQDDYRYLPHTEGVDQEIEQVVQLLLDRWQDRLTDDQRGDLVAYRDGRRPLPVLAPAAEGR